MFSVFVLALERPRGTYRKKYVFFNIFKILINHSKVGGVWEQRCELSVQIKSEFGKFCELLTYEIVTVEMWGYTMPFWMEAILGEWYN